MNRVVADASHCGAWILPDEATEAAAGLLEEIASGQVELVVPALWMYEMGNLIRSACRRGRLTKLAASAAQELLNEVPLALCDAPGAVARSVILKLSLKHNLSYHDAAYLELAARLKIPLHTQDARLRAAATAERVKGRVGPL